MAKVEFNPNDLFEEVVIDPRLDNKEAKAVEKDLRNWGFANKIIKSTLYMPRKFVIKFKV